MLLYNFGISILSKI